MKGYSKVQRPTEGGPKPPIDGFAVSSNPPDYIEGEAFNTKESPGNSKSDGDNPSFPAVPFANGTDNRNRG